MVTALLELCCGLDAGMRPAAPTARPKRCMRRRRGVVQQAKEEARGRGARARLEHRDALHHAVPARTLAKPGEQLGLRARVEHQPAAARAAQVHALARNRQRRHPARRRPGHQARLGRRGRRQLVGGEAGLGPRIQGVGRRRGRAAGVVGGRGAAALGAGGRRGGPRRRAQARARRRAAPCRCAAGRHTPPGSVCAGAAVPNPERRAPGSVPECMGLPMCAAPGTVRHAAWVASARRHLCPALVAPCAAAALSQARRSASVQGRCLGRRAPTESRGLDAAGSPKVPLRAEPARMLTCRPHILFLDWLHFLLLVGSCPECVKQCISDCIPRIQGASISQGGCWERPCRQRLCAALSVQQRACHAGHQTRTRAPTLTRTHACLPVTLALLQLQRMCNGAGRPMCAGTRACLVERAAPRCPSSVTLHACAACSQVRHGAVRTAPGARSSCRRSRRRRARRRPRRLRRPSRPPGWPPASARTSTCCSSAAAPSRPWPRRPRRPPRRCPARRARVSMRACCIPRPCPPGRASFQPRVQVNQSQPRCTCGCSLSGILLAAPASG